MNPTEIEVEWWVTSLFFLLTLKAHSFFRAGSTPPAARVAARQNRRSHVSCIRPFVASSSIRTNHLQQEEEEENA